MRAIGVAASEYDPPWPWKHLQFWLKQGGNGQHKSRVVGSLSDEELTWAGRVIAAEIHRRKAIKSGNEGV